MIDLFIGEDFATSRDPDAWDYGTEPEDATERIARILTETPSTEASDLVIVIRKSEED